MSVLSRAIALCAMLCLALPTATSAAGGSYLLVGGTSAQRREVRLALEASSFDWGLVPRTVTIRIVRGAVSQATPGTIILDADLLDAGTFAWGVVQHEYAHQVDYFLFDDSERAELLRLLGGRDWCYGVPGLQHEDYGCERFASMLAWAFWPSPENCMTPGKASAAATRRALQRFRTLVYRLAQDPAH